MKPRKPPALANWLLNRSGFARQNQPLAGDLLEEFRGGRSAAWYWRQTLVVILTGLARNARLFWRSLMAYIVGWAAEVSITFTMWWFHYPRQLHGAAAIALSLTVILLTVILMLSMCSLFAKVLRRKRPSREAESTFENATDLVISGGGIFIGLLIGYCIVALLQNMSLWDFLLTQAIWLTIWIKDVLLQESPPRRNA